MKSSPRTYLERKPGQLVAEFEADGFSEHGRLPGLVDLSELLDDLQLEEKALLNDDGHRTPITVLALGGIRPVRLEAVEHYVKAQVEGPFHAAWTAGDDELKFLIAASNIDGMRALREIYGAALAGRAFASFSDQRFGLKLVAIEDGKSVADAELLEN